LVCQQCGHDFRQEPGAREPALSFSTLIGALAGEQRPPKATLRIQFQSGDLIERELARVETRLGKGPDNDVVFADPTISTHHALISADENGYTIEDVGSRNGTFVNDERVTGPRRLRDGDVIKLGRSTVVFRLGHHQEAAPLDHITLTDATPPIRSLPLTEEFLAQAIAVAGLVPKAELERLRKGGERRLYRALLDEQLASEEQLRDLMSSAFHLPITDLRAAQVDEAAIAAFPAWLARDGRVFPLVAEAERWTIAIADPTETAVVEEVKRATARAVELKLATASEISQMLEQHYGPKLIGVLPAGEKFEYLIRQPEVEIGKAPHNHIVLTEPTVSGTHAIILARSEGYSIIDLGSRNGTFVNGERLGDEARTLKHGDKIKLGQVLLTYRNPAEASEHRTAQLPAERLEEVRQPAGVGKVAEWRAAPATIAPVAPPPQSIPAVAFSPPARRAPGSVTPLEMPPLATAAPESVTANGATGEDERKKKKKKKRKDDRLKAAMVNSLSRIVATILSAVLTVVITILALRSGSGTNSSTSLGTIGAGEKGHLKSKFSDPGLGTAFQGGLFEASGVVHVSGADGVLFVDDGRSGEALWMQLDASGKQVGEIKAIPLGVKVGDPEGITYGGAYFYIVGSQADPAAGEKNTLIRFAFDAANQRLQRPAEVITDLRGLLLKNVPELKGQGELPGTLGGLNIEGIAWDPIHERLLIGLRSPVVGGQALVVPLKLANPLGPFAASNLQLAEPRVIRLPLGGHGIRDLHYDSRLKSFLVLSGAPENVEKTDFKLWEWDGSSDQKVGGDLREVMALDHRMKPEGLTRAVVNGREFVFLVGDASVYLKLDYAASQ
jgi:pSer/pThr/pTyr-binding forkhead associated (FHA) protein